MEKILSGFSKLHWALKTLIYVLFAVLLLAFVTGINEQHFSPFSLSRALLYPIGIASNGKSTVIIDNYKKNILFCDEEGRLTKIADLTKAGSPADRAEVLHIVGDSVYVLATEQINDGIYLKSESVLKYDLKGNYKGTLYHFDFPDNEYHEKTTVRAIGDDGVRLLLAQLYNGRLSILRVGPEEGKEPEILKSTEVDRNVSDIVFLPGTESIVYPDKNTGGKLRPLMNYDDEITDPEHIDNVLQEIEELDFKNITGGDHAYDALKRLSEIIRQTNTSQFYFYVDDSISVINISMINDGTGKDPDSCYVIDITKKELYRYDLAAERSEKIDSIPLHPLLFISNLLFWLAVVMLAAVLLILIINFIRKRWNRRTRAFLLMMLVLTTVSIFFSNRENDSILEQYQDNLIATSKLIKELVSTKYGEWLSGLNSESSDSGSTKLHEKTSGQNMNIVEDIDSTLKIACHSQKKENSYYAQVFLIGPDQKVFFVSDSTGIAHFGTVSEYWDNIDDKILNNVGKVIVEDGLVNKTFGTFQLITDRNGNVIGFVEVGNDLSNLISTMNKREIDLTINLIAVLIVLFVLYRVVGTFRGDLAAYREKRKAGSSDCGVALSGMYSFMLSITIRLDSVILPLLAIRLCRDMPAEQAAMLAALPITARAIGLWLGEFAFVPMTKWLGERRCAILSQILCIAFCIAEAWCVGASNIYLFTAAKLGFAFFASGIMYAFRRTIPLGAKSDEERARAIISNSQGSIAATVLSLLLGGYITQYVSDVMLYIVGAVLSVPLLILCMFIFPADEKTKTGAGSAAYVSGAHRKGAALVLLSPSILLMLACAWLPFSLLNGYSSYLFPLYSRAVGITAVLLSSLSVFAQAFNFATAKSTAEMLKPYGRKKVTLMFIIASCLCLILSILSQNIWWAVLCLFVCEFAAKQILINFEIDVAENIPEKLDAKSARHYVAIAQDGIDTVTKPALAALVPVGHFAGSAIAGAVCVILAGVRAVYERARTKKKTEKTAAEHGING